MVVVAQAIGLDRRIADRRPPLRHSWRCHTYSSGLLRAAFDRLRQGHHDLYRGVGGVVGVPSSLADMRVVRRRHDSSRQRVADRPDI